MNTTELRDRSICQVGGAQASKTQDESDERDPYPSPEEWISWISYELEQEEANSKPVDPPSEISTIITSQAHPHTSYDEASSIQMSWENSPLQPNQTYLDLSSKENKIPSKCLAHRSHYDLIYPNYRRLELVNRDMWRWKEENKKRLHSDDYWRFAHAIMCQLEMTNYQKERFYHLFWSLTPQDRQRMGRSVEELIFGVCMLVCWEDGRKASPRQKPWDAEFERLAAELGYRKSLSLLEKAKRQLKPWLKGECQRRSPLKSPTDPYSLAAVKTNTGISEQRSPA